MVPITIPKHSQHQHRSDDQEQRIHGVPHQRCSGNRVSAAPHHRTRAVRAGTGTAAGTHL